MIKLPECSAVYTFHVIFIYQYAENFLPLHCTKSNLFLVFFSFFFFFLNVYSECNYLLTLCQHLCFIWFEKLIAFISQQHFRDWGGESAENGSATVRHQQVHQSLTFPYVMLFIVHGWIIIPNCNFYGFERNAHTCTYVFHLKSHIDELQEMKEICSKLARLAINHLPLEEKSWKNHLAMFDLIRILEIAVK